jgi:hypothetical protein
MAIKDIMVRGQGFISYIYIYIYIYIYMKRALHTGTKLHIDTKLKDH